MGPSIVYLAAGDSGEDFWVQLLVVVILAACAGIYSAVKSHAKRVERKANDETIETFIEQPRPPIKRRCLNNGMELLARDFLVRVVEQTETADQRDVAMRGMCFAELVRRNELWAVASNALKVYTLDADGFYGGSIRCEAMRELASRTRLGEGADGAKEEIDAPSRSRTGRSPRDAADETPLRRQGFGASATSNAGRELNG